MTEPRTAQSAQVATTASAGTFKLATGVMAGVLSGYFLLPLVAPRGWESRPTEDLSRTAFLSQFATRDKALSWLSDTASSLERKTSHLAAVSPAPLERRELENIRRHLQQLQADATRKVDPDLMYRANELNSQLAESPQSPPQPVPQPILIRPPLDR